MTEQEKAKKLLPIIQAIAEGKKIQYSFNGVTWFDKDTNLELNVICNDIISDATDYRIKPEDTSIASFPNKSCYKCGKKLTIENMASIMLTSNPPKYMCKKCAGEESEENYTIEQNAGENRIEGGIVSISGSAKVYTCKDCLRYQFCYLAEKRKDKACMKISLCKETEKQYRPFKDCNELIEHYQKKYDSAVGCDIYFPSLYKPNIWVKRYEHTRDVLMNRTFLITGFEDSGVVVDNKWIGMDELLEKYKFLDDSPVGKLEE